MAQIENTDLKLILQSIIAVANELSFLINDLEESGLISKGKYSNFRNLEHRLLRASSGISGGIPTRALDDIIDRYEHIEHKERLGRTERSEQFKRVDK